MDRTCPAIHAGEPGSVTGGDKKYTSHRGNVRQVPGPQKWLIKISFSPFPPGEKILSWWVWG